MVNEFGRNRRVADLVQRELAVLIQRYIQGNRFGLITVSCVDVSPDLKNAKIFFTCLDNTASVEEITTSLNEHVGQLRHELAKKLVLRNIPKLHFIFDQNLERANRLSALIETLHSDNSGNK